MHAYNTCSPFNSILSHQFSIYDIDWAEGIYNWLHFIHVNNAKWNWFGYFNIVPGKINGCRAVYIRHSLIICKYSNGYHMEALSMYAWVWYGMVWYGGYITHRFSWLSQIIREKEIWISSVLNENFNVKCQSQSTPDTAMHSCLIQSTLSMLKLLLCMCAYIYLSHFIRIDYTVDVASYRFHHWV